jgi:probable rRNA maturation factor
MSLHIETAVECESWRSLPDLEAMVQRCIMAVLAETGEKLRDGAEVSLLLCDDARIRILNRQFRGMDKPTNVLSFPGPDPIDAARVLGDIAIAYETVAREAAEQDKLLPDHVCHMIVHGFFHLLGYDHETDEEAEDMEAGESRTLQSLGIADPYGCFSKPEGH